MKNNATVMNVMKPILYGVLAAMTFTLCMGENTMAQTSSAKAVKNVVLVHGGFVDGSGWQRVYNALKKDGYTVTIVQNPTISLADVTPPVIANASADPAVLWPPNHKMVAVTLNYGVSDNCDLPQGIANWTSKYRRLVRRSRLVPIAFMGTGMSCPPA